MKKVVLVMALTIYSLSGYAQNDHKHKAEFGFSLGANYTNLLPNHDQIDPNQSYLHEVHQTTSGYGFSLGVLMEKRLTNYLLFSPRLDLSFNGSQFSTQFPDGTIKTTDISAVTVEFSPLMTIRPESEKLMPYFLFGPNLKLPISDQETLANIKPELAVDFGIGLNRPLKAFNLAPELKYSYNLTNLGYQADVEKIYAHRISLLFNFRG